jgi:hypothetical protein
MIQIKNLKLKIKNCGIPSGYYYNVPKASPRGSARRALLIFAFCIFNFAFVCSAPAWAETGQELVEKAAELDGKTIEFQGEVVGDVMLRGEHAWINVNDGTRTIGVWIKKSQAENIEFTGDYNYLGDMVKLTGVFHRACSVHGGDLDIHAEKFAVAQKGELIDHPVNPAKAVIAGILFIAVIGAIFLPSRLKTKS